MKHHIVFLALLSLARPAEAQSVLERSPNLQGVWTLPAGQAAFVFAHRFEVIDGGDELRNLPTLTLAAGLPLGLTAGLDYTSNSEISQASTGANEVEYWLKRSASLTHRFAVAGLVGYNSAAESMDAAVDARVGMGRLSLLGELRGFSDAFGSGEGAVAAAGGGILRLTPYLGVAGDLGKVVTTDTLGTVWSASLAVAIPGTPHTFALQAANNGATTLQSASRRPESAIKSVRYGFTFTVPLGTASQWGRIFRPAPSQPSEFADTSVVRVDIRQIAFAPTEIRVHVGQRVEWLNSDPTVHTVTSDEEGAWGSELILEGGRYSRVFDRAGRFPYHCLPHPMMKGVVIVEE